MLGFLVGFLAHAIPELLYIKLLLSDFETYSVGFSWQTLLAIHHVLAFVLFFGGGLLGYREGVYWWRVIYIEHRLDRFFAKIRRVFLIR